MSKEMKVSQFTEAVAGLIDYLGELYPGKSLEVSDVHDNIDWNSEAQRTLLEKFNIDLKEHRQYVDLIQEGGGIHGIALAGYTYVLEKMGISFLNSAGTSAGAINTMMLNCVYSRRDAIMTGKSEAFVSTCYETRSEKILEYLSKKDLSELVDGHPSWRDLILKIFSKRERGPVLKKLKRKARLSVFSFLFFLVLLVVTAAGVSISSGDPARWQTAVNVFLIISVLGLTASIAIIIKNIMSVRLLYFHSEKMGINPGDDFKDWIRGLMEENGINSILDLKEKMLQENELYNYRYDAYTPPVNVPQPTTASKMETEGKMANITRDVSELKAESAPASPSHKTEPENKDAGSNFIADLAPQLIDRDIKGIVGEYIKKTPVAAVDQAYIDALLKRIVSGISDFNQTNWQDLKTINDKLIEQKFIPLNENKNLISEVLQKLYSYTKRVVNASNNKFTQQLVVVAADITNQIKVEFPGMHEFYWGNDYSVSPAEYVRASMSIPFFFRPYKVTLSNTELIEINETWKVKLGAYKNFSKGNNEVLFVDGGALSNFPINVFYSNTYSIPTRPTFGIKLEFDNDDLYKLIDNETKLALSMISTMRYFYDRDFLNRHSNFKKTVRSVDTGGISWLNFNPSENEKLELFYRGALAATIFLAGKHLTAKKQNELLIKAREQFGIEEFKTEDFIYPDIFFDWKNYKEERGMSEIYKNLSPKLKDKSSFTN